MATTISDDIEAAFLFIANADTALTEMIYLAEALARPEEGRHPEAVQQMGKRLHDLGYLASDQLGRLRPALEAMQERPEASKAAQGTTGASK